MATATDTSTERAQIEAAQRRRDESLQKLLNRQNMEDNQVRLARVERVRQQEIQRANKEHRPPDTVRADALQQRIEKRSADREKQQAASAQQYSQAERDLQARIGNCKDPKLRAEMAEKSR